MIELLAWMETSGKGLTCTTVCTVEVHRPNVPVIVYCVETDGVAITEAPEAVFKFVEGNQLYIDAPDAKMLAGKPLHTVAEFTVNTGIGFTVTVL